MRWRIARSSRTVVPTRRTPCPAMRSRTAMPGAKPRNRRAERPTGCDWRGYARRGRRPASWRSAPSAAPRLRRDALELYFRCALHRGFLRFVDVEEFLRAEPQRVGEQHVREAFAGGVVFRGGVVEEAP